MGLDVQNNTQKSFFKLSGGMKQKLLIAMAIAKNSDILIFDEPMANLDLDGRKNLCKLLDGLDENKIILFITHRVDEIVRFINRAINMDLGEVTSDERA